MTKRWPSESTEFLQNGLHAYNETFVFLCEELAKVVSGIEIDVIVSNELMMNLPISLHQAFLCKCYELKEFINKDRPLVVSEAIAKHVTILISCSYKPALLKRHAVITGFLKNPITDVWRTSWLYKTLTWENGANHIHLSMIALLAVEVFQKCEQRSACSGLSISQFDVNSTMLTYSWYGKSSYSFTNNNEQNNDIEMCDVCEVDALFEKMV